MDELVVVPLASPGEQLVAQPEFPEPIAEHNFNRKKLCTLEQGIGKLQRSAREQHEVLANVESEMKAMISETDLRRAIGLAFQEFEHRLEDAFQDSNRKCLAMFSKKDEVNEIQTLIGKKVNWTEYNTVLKKLSELRQYLDTMAESIFIGHREALNQEFAKKADREAVDQALKTKANNDEVNEVRARLERLEVLVARTDAKLTAKIDAQKDEATGHAMLEAHKKQEMIAENISAIEALRRETLALTRRIDSADSERAGLIAATNKLREVQTEMAGRQEAVVLPFITSFQDQKQEQVEKEEILEKEVEVLLAKEVAFEEDFSKKARELTAITNTCKEQVEFLMQETEMIKRRSREASKSNAGKFKELSEEDSKLLEQLAGLERQLKKQERGLHTLERQAARMQDSGGVGMPLQALPAPPEPVDANDRLRGVLQQLEKIAAAGPPTEKSEQAAIVWNPQRPPLPSFGGTGQTMQRGTDADLASLPRLSAPDQDMVSPIDSARGGPPTAAAVKGMYGLSPRSAPSSVKTPRKKR